MTGSGRRICALIVTYNPDPVLLGRVLAGIAPQVETVLLVDNGSDRSPLDTLESPPATATVELLPLGQNLGLAAAQNRGIGWARSRAFSHLLLFDQDSLVEPDMVAALADGLERLQADGQPVAAVGPVYIDPRTGSRRPFVRFPGLGIRRTDCTPNRPWAETDFLIASGTLAPLESFERIGTFEEALFIDNVDLEWSFRARARGYRLYGVCAAHMHHYLGDDALRIWLGRWWHVYRHSPLRQYYMARNRVVLYRRDYSPRGWVVQDLLRFLVKLFWFGVVFPPRLENLRMIGRGLRDGFAGRLGPFGK